MASTQSSWSARALALCMAAHGRLGASCLDAVRSVASSRDLVCAIMWHVFPHEAPLVVKVQYISEKLHLDATLAMVEVVAHATKRLKLTSALDGVPLILKIDGVLDVLLDRPSSALPPSTPDLLELKTNIHAVMIAKSEAAWRAMQEARKQNIATDHAAAAARPQVVRSEGSAEGIRKWLREHCVSFPEGSSLAELEALAAEAEAAIAEEEAAMAEYNSSRAARGQPTVVSAISTSGASRTVLDEARAGEELARRELMEAARDADALVEVPVAVGSAVVSPAAESPSSSLSIEGLPMVMAEAVSVIDENTGRRPKGGIVALTNMLHIG